MAESNSVTVIVTKFQKYKGRKDVENPSWMKVSNRLLEDPDLYHFTHEEMLVWLQILARASQKQCETVVLDVTHCERVCRLSPTAVHSAIEKLQALKIIDRVTSARRRRNVGVTASLRGIEENREEKKREEENREEPPAGLDFEKLYEKYPRKEGKTEGMKRLNARNYPLATCLELEKAVENYAAKCKLEQTEHKFIKHWSSFVGTDDKETWRDYVDWSPPVGTGVETPAEWQARILRESEERKERLARGEWA